VGMHQGSALSPLLFLIVMEATPREFRVALPWELRYADDLALASMVKCCTNHIITQISIQTAGLAFGSTGLCSYRVRGVDGSCAKHLTVESYTVVMLLTFILITISIPSSPIPSFQA